MKVIYYLALPNSISQIYNRLFTDILKNQLSLDLESFLALSEKNYLSLNCQEKNLIIGMCKKNEKYVDDELTFQVLFR